METLLAHAASRTYHHHDIEGVIRGKSIGKQTNVRRSFYTGQQNYHTGSKGPPPRSNTTTYLRRLPHRSWHKSHDGSIYLVIPTPLTRRSKRTLHHSCPLSFRYTFVIPEHALIRSCSLSICLWPGIEDLGWHRDRHGCRSLLPKYLVFSPSILFARYKQSLQGFISHIRKFLQIEIPSLCTQAFCACICMN